MFCGNCGCEVAEGAKFCSNCGNRVEVKNSKSIYIALVLTFFISGLGSIYAGNKIKGLILLILRIAFVIIGWFVSIFLVFSVLVWAYAFYEAYKDVQIANGCHNPKLINDFKTWDQNNKITAAVVIVIILFITLSCCASFFIVETYSPSHSGSHYYSSGSSGSSGSSHHYGGVDTSPNTIAKNDPDWYYDYYEYGDNPDIDDYLESEGYD